MSGDGRPGTGALVLRLALVTVVFVVAAVGIDALLQRLVPVLVLPPLFLTLSRGALALTLVALLAATWVHGRSGPSDEPPSGT